MKLLIHFNKLIDFAKTDKNLQCFRFITFMKFDSDQEDFLK